MPNNDDIKFEKFKETLPDNLKNTNEETYNLRGYWESLGKPEEFDYSQPKETDGYYHAFSRNPQTGEILKKENHPTFKMAIEGDAKAGYKAYRNKETGKVYTFKKEPDKNKYEIFKSTNMPKKINLQNLKLGYTDGTKVSKEDTKAFLIKLNEMSQKYEGTTPEDFLTLFIKENGLKDGVLLLDQKSKATTNDKGGRARGLIQFVPSTAEGLGLDQEKTATMKPVEQLDFVDKFYNTYKNSIEDYQSLYLATFYPAALEQDDDFPIAEREQTAYTSNKAIDINKDGKITVGDFKKYAANTKPAQPKNLFEEVSDDVYTQSYVDLIAPPKPKYVVGEDENGKYVETLVDKGQPKIDFDPNKRGSSSQPGERYVKNYVKGAESVGVRTIGNNEYVVQAYTDDNGVLQNEYFSFVEKGSGKNNLQKENKYDLYNREISEIMQGGLTKENVDKARDVYDTAKEDYRRSGDSELPNKDQKSYRVGNHFYELAGAPLLQEEIKIVKEIEQKKLLDLQDKHANAFGEKKQKIAEQIKKTEKDYSDIVKQEKEITRSIESIKKGTPPDIMTQGTPAVFGNLSDDLRKEINQFGWYEDLFNKDAKKYKESEAYKDYTKYLKDLETQQLEKERAKGASFSSKEKVTTSNFVTDTDGQPDPNDIDSTEKEVPLGQGEYLDKQALEDTLAEINKQLDDSETVEEFTPDLSMLDKQNSDRYGNLISMAGDLGAGIMGLKGAMEEVPVYEKGEMFNAYTDEAYRQRNMGLTGEEMGLRKQLAERGFGYDVKNIRRLSGGSAGVALGNLGRAAGTLQTRYGQIAAEDSAVRRMNQQRFDRAAGADETFNRRKFEDSFKVAMLNKEMGAQLVRDKMKNMHERNQFEKQYGKGSVYDALSREMLASKQANTHALKMAQEYQVEKQKDDLTKRKIQIESDLRKANNQ